MSKEIAHKRTIKDIQLLEKNKQDLNERGIFFYINSTNIFDISFLIIAKHKQDLSDSDLISPYTDGFFVFKLAIPVDFPLSPPSVEFHPKQNECRLHPNYYENGKVCLSVMNTWGNEDWCPSTSLFALANIFEERLNECPLRFEPGRELSSSDEIKKFNKIVRYGVYKVAIWNVFLGKYSSNYDIFKDVIDEHWQKNKDKYISDLEKLAALYPTNSTVNQPHYNHSLKINYCEMLNQMRIIP
jgi:ubiquitin-protein ligase